MIESVLLWCVTNTRIHYTIESAVLLGVTVQAVLF